MTWKFAELPLLVRLENGRRKQHLVRWCHVINGSKIDERIIHVAYGFPAALRRQRLGAGLAPPGARLRIIPRSSPNPNPYWHTAVPDTITVPFAALLTTPLTVLPLTTKLAGMGVTPATTWLSKTMSTLPATSAGTGAEVTLAPAGLVIVPVTTSPASKFSTEIVTWSLAGFTRVRHLNRRRSCALVSWASAIRTDKQNTVISILVTFIFTLLILIFILLACPFMLCIPKTVCAWTVNRVADGTKNIGNPKKIWITICEKNMATPSGHRCFPASTIG